MAWRFLCSVPVLGVDEKPNPADAPETIAAARRWGADKRRRSRQWAACLLCPFHGKRLQKPRQRHPFRLRPVQDRHDHVRRRTKQTTRRLSGYIQGGHLNRKAIAGAPRSVYRAENAEAGLAVLEAFEAGPWGQNYPAIAQTWRRHWDQVIPFFVFSPPIRRIIYTMNTIDALNSKLRRAVRTRGHFPGDEAAMELIYLVLNRAVEECRRPPREWCEAKTQFAILFGDRFVL